jgi:hypothetical protein
VSPEALTKNAFEFLLQRSKKKSTGFVPVGPCRFRVVEPPKSTDEPLVVEAQLVVEAVQVPQDTGEVPEPQVM